MYLLNLTLEDGLDNIIDIAEPLTVILTDKDITQVFEGSDDVSLYDKIKAGAVPAVLKCLKLHKNEILLILANLQGQNVVEYSKKIMFEIIADVIALVNDPQISELRDLFISAQSREI